MVGEVYVLAAPAGAIPDVPNDGALVQIPGTDMYLRRVTPGELPSIAPPAGLHDLFAMRRIADGVSRTAGFDSAAALQWHDASDVPTISHVGGAVSAIANKISGGLALTGSGTTGVGASNVNGLNTIVMDRAQSNSLETSGALLPAAGNWLWTLVVGIGAVGHINSGLVYGTGGDVGLYITANHASQFNGTFNIGGVAGAFANPPYAGLHVVQIAADLTGAAPDPGTAKVFVDNVEVTTISYEAAVNAVTWSLFRYGSQYLGGQFCESIISADPAEQVAAHDFVATKWGLAA
ncbi:hypothetical protein [Rhodovulum kholense]|uniref:Uncharacterized protein n=1 Tax=Rhodovulum kholense TaxID=453584 RepID=A0A8E3AQM0_9RHOB|nr:hypothetical protein [Rhodovulum kholense]PTW48334.1 hypothetical protein C8N38_10886 [Rhodovulum kholense]